MRITSSFRPGDLLALDPGRGVADDPVDVAVASPVGVEHRALGRDRDVVGQRRDDLLVPLAIRVVGDRRRFVGLHRQLRVAGIHARLLGKRRV